MSDSDYTIRRLNVLEQMLRLHADIVLDSTGQGSGALGDRLLLLCDDYRDPATLNVRAHWRELERCLELMRAERDWQRKHMLAFFQAPTRLGKVLRPVQRTGRYRQPLFDEKGVPLYERDRTGRTVMREDVAVLPIVAAWISKPEAFAGLRWLEARYQGEPQVPVEAIGKAA